MGGLVLGASEVNTYREMMSTKNVNLKATSSGRIKPLTVVNSKRFTIITISHLASPTHTRTHTHTVSPPTLHLQPPWSLPVKARQIGRVQYTKRGAVPRELTPGANAPQDEAKHQEGAHRVNNNASYHQPNDGRVVPIL